ncbi:MAG: response regulator [Syntrophobacteraceae bacterium]|jgi:CheY-like chemotaxis protein|nr:response regulator [Syntrophobacteraceae bacterium]
MAKKVLIVDDELDIRVFMSTLLETNGYRPIATEDGKLGIELARKHKPSLVIMDIMMPRESGINLYRELKKDPGLRSVPDIMVSAIAQKTFLHSQQLLDAYEGGQIPEPAAYIEKPAEPHELLQAVQRALP